MTDSPNNTSKTEKVNAFNIEEHILRYGYLDGFGERLLSIELLVNLDFQFELRYNSFQEDQIINSGVLPNIICAELRELIELNLYALEQDYNIHEGVTDFPFYTLSINQYGEIWSFMIGHTPVVTDTSTGLEKLFFSILNSLKVWLINETGYEIE